MKSKSSYQHVSLFLKGIAMGAADVVPGVSGGTIAFISGIYQELIETIHQLDLQIFKLFKQEGFKACWHKYNLKFIFILFSGVITSILLFAKLISWLLSNHPILVWSFFFGLIVASIFYIAKQIKLWNGLTGIFILIASIASYLITVAEPIASTESYWVIFFSGFIAIIAMILPGISGSFILLLLGVYEIILNTVNDFSTSIITLNFKLLTESFSKIMVFIIGAIAGLKLFSSALNWLFKHHKNITLSILTGFMIGALNKIWPWKEIVTWRLKSNGEQVALLEKSILPTDFDGDPKIIMAVVFMIIGFLSIFLIELIAAYKSKKNG